MSEDNGNDNTQRSPKTAHLKPPWQPGQSGNPKRPSERRSKDGPRARLRRWLNRAAPEEVVEHVQEEWASTLEKDADMAEVIVEVLGKQGPEGRGLCLEDDL